jgi:hypothetical protein
MKRTVVVILSQGRPPTTFVADAVPEGFERDGETFRWSPDFGDWLGFYDWLRTERGLIVGVRLRPDTPGLMKLFEPYICPAILIEDGAVKIRTTADGAVVEARSDDADFGGNRLFMGNAGSLAVSFFCPSDWA